MIVKPTKAATRAVLDAAWQKVWDDSIASMSKIEWEVLAFAAKPGRRSGAFDIVSEVTRHQKAARLTAIRRLLVFGFLRNVPGRAFGSISEDGLKALAEKNK